ncbi:MAG: L-threonylcarbamoyladenylate synthase, partial [Bacteroidota bacterium]|nr:L-threonylcarbamoyladenylate synthase [Bacteroidota bacterium]
MQNEINKALEVLKNGGTILYPTDTIWGIGCDATNESAIARIFDIKKRESKAMISLVCNTAMIDDYTNSNQLQISLSDKPTSVIYQNVNRLASNLIAKDKTAAFRISSDEFCHRLVSEFGVPIVSTSANISGKDLPKQFSEISDKIKDNVDYVVNL